ncbi:hypothetical protein ABGB09_29615 [Streptomyces sp. B8F3]|uniref:hypothetical protein n=1 Tax=Streptomyces sp. B8F3 TaxID=3153573 RepID=UPI00325F7DAB
MTVGDLIAILEQYDEGAQIRLATQPQWPFEWTIQEVGTDDSGTVWIAQGEQLGYLSQEAAEALGWRH